MPYALAKRNIIERKYATKSVIPPTTYRGRDFLPCGVGEDKEDYELYVISKVKAKELEQKFNIDAQ